MKITLCVEENRIECKERGSDIKAIYQIPHFDLRKQRKNKTVICCPVKSAQKLTAKYHIKKELMLHVES